MNPLLAGAIGAIGGRLVTKLPMHLLGREQQKVLKGLPRNMDIPEAIDQTAKDYGVRIGYSKAPTVMTGNAGYLDTGYVADRFGGKKKLMTELEAGSKDKKTDPDTRAMARELFRGVGASKKHGVIMTGSGFAKPGIIEHELGHAIAKHKGTGLERFVHNPMVEGLRPFYGSVPAFALGSYLTSKGRPGAGALASLGWAGLTMAPTLYREHAANRYAREMMDEKTNKKMRYWPFIGTYATSGIVPSVAGGMLAGELIRRFPQES